MGSKAVRRIQQTLKDKGFDPGEVDGIWGRNTIAAVKEFQKQNSLEVDGIVGPQTTAALFADAPSPTAGPFLPWFEEAMHLVGTKEVLGLKTNPTIMDWATSLDINYNRNGSCFVSQAKIGTYSPVRVSSPQRAGESNYFASDNSGFSAAPLSTFAERVRPIFPGSVLKMVLCRAIVQCRPQNIGYRSRHLTYNRGYSC
jgi:peptidoglycan hydrolase-like protein with peptidoglycan-binding domain